MVQILCKTWSIGKLLYVTLTWYFSGGPTVSTYTSDTWTLAANALLMSPMAELWDTSFSETFGLEDKALRTLGISLKMKKEFT